MFEKPPAIPVNEAPLPTNEEAVIVPVGVDIFPEALMVAIVIVPVGDEMLPEALKEAPLTEPAAARLPPVLIVAVLVPLL
jgi:hypothetical protein